MNEIELTRKVDIINSFVDSRHNELKNNLLEKFIDDIIDGNIIQQNIDNQHTYELSYRDIVKKSIIIQKLWK